MALAFATESDLRLTLQRIPRSAASELLGIKAPILGPAVQKTEMTQMT